MTVAKTVLLAAVIFLWGAVCLPVKTVPRPHEPDALDEHGARVR